MDPIAVRLNHLVVPIGIVLAIVSVLRRKEAIGGWLLFFFGQVYAGLFFAVLASVPIVAKAFAEQYLPQQSASHALATVVLLRLIGHIILAVASTFLLQERNPIWVERLRFALGALLLLNGLTLFVDRVYFPSAFVTNLLRWFGLVVWLIYLFVSARVRMVFFSKTWGETPPEKIFA